MIRRFYSEGRHRYATTETFTMRRENRYHCPNQYAKSETLLSFLTQLGLRYKFGKTMSSQYGYLSEPDHVRRSDIEDMIRRHPKIFWGYSNIMVSH